jgi:type II secretory pathway component PulK
MRTQGSEGFVLVTVLWVLAILTVVSLGFGHRANLERRAAAYSLDRAQAGMMARAALQRGIVEVRNKGYMDLLDDGTRGGTHLGQEWARQKNLLDGEYFEPMENFEQDFVSYIIEDLERRADINMIEKEFLDNLEGLSQAARRTIWSRRTEGVHENEPYAPFIAPEELRYLRSVSDDDWFGRRGEPGLRDLIAVYGGAKINFNTAHPQVLASVPGLKKTVVDDILRYRAGSDGELYTEDDTGFEHWQDLVDTLTVDADSSAALSRYCKADSTYFKITGIATRRAGKVRVQCSAVVRLGDGGGIVVEWQEAPIGS